MYHVFRCMILAGGCSLLIGAFPLTVSAGCAYGTKVALVNGEGYELRSIEEIGFRDGVYSLVRSEKGLELESRGVRYSYGTGPAATEPGMIRVSFGAAESSGDITVTDRHVFLVANSSPAGAPLKRAIDLIPGADMLVDYQGKAVPVRSIAFITYRGGIHHIATSTNLDDSWEGHLIITNGIISGDYLLQLSYSEIDSAIPAGLSTFVARASSKL